MKPSHGPRAAQLDNDQAIPEDLTARLYQATERNVGDVVAGLSLAQRANLAMFCYHKAHLRRAGLAIAATCDRDTLVQAWGTSLGQTLYDQAQVPLEEPAKKRGPYRPIMMGKASVASDYGVGIDWILESQRVIKH
jgi:hypothetical protein